MNFETRPSDPYYCFIVGAFLWWFYGDALVGSLLMIIGGYLAVS